MPDLPPDELASPHNLVFRCRLLSVWRDGPFLTFVIPTQHSRANLTAEESGQLIQVLATNRRRSSVIAQRGKPGSKRATK